MSTSVVKCSEGLSNRVSNIKKVYRSYEFATYMAFLFLTFFMFLLEIFIVIYIVLCFVHFYLCS